MTRTNQTSTLQSLDVPAHAKINLALSVGPPRLGPGGDGFHPIASWFVALALHDTVRLARLPAGEPSAHRVRWATGDDGLPAPKPTPIDWPIERDLAVRAHRALEQRIGVDLPTNIEIIKRTPVGGGLGGGSADAAATLLGLRALFDLPLSQADLIDISRPLGSDIAFFIDEHAAPSNARMRSTDDPPHTGAPRPALVTGLGERITRVDAPRQTDVLLLIPPVACPTGPVYKAFDTGLSTSHALREEAVRALITDASAGRPIPAARLFNDLAHPACIVAPRLGELFAALNARLGPKHRVHITGSGSTMFIVPDGTAALSELAAQAEAIAPELIVLRTSTA